MSISSINVADKYKYCLEKGPNGQLGVRTNNGGNYTFFTPLSELEKREEAIKQFKSPSTSTKEESPEEYYKRKINSHEWMG